ncbi:MAG: hypothetical protein EP348_11105 [Alphaproteobacteria bacterium]|nr:MAG: hypothetical protein EP348_11105 [Alphaproteobacteria bacterium]
MSKAILPALSTGREGNGTSPLLSATGRLLGLLAAPTFAAMAIASAVSGAPILPSFCSGGTAPFGGALNGMTIMYLLMAVFHLRAWFSLPFFIKATGS